MKKAFLVLFHFTFLSIKLSDCWSVPANNCLLRAHAHSLYRSRGEL